MPVRLSVCVPTYNFGAFLGETLASLARQIEEEVEIVVVDGASTDNTEEVAREFQSSYPAIRYVRLEKRGGIDKDMATAVELARGNYCWLLSADDLAADGAIPRILDEIRGAYDVCLCGLTRCTLQMKPIAKHPVLSGSTDAVYDLSDVNTRLTYFQSAVTTTAFFSYMSSLVINKARWNEVGGDDAFVGSCWAHVARIFRMIPRGLRVRYLGGEYVLSRSENDSFLEHGLVHRIAISVEGFNRLAEAFFGKESPEAYHIRRVLKNEYTLAYLLHAKLMSRLDGEVDVAMRLDRLVRTIYADKEFPDVVRHAVYRYSPVSALKIAKTLRQKARRLSRY